MCLAIPACVTEIISPEMVRVRVGDAETFMETCSMLLPEQPKIGEYLIIHAGFALRVLDPLEAEESLLLLKEVAEVGTVMEF